MAPSLHAMAHGLSLPSDNRKKLGDLGAFGQEGVSTALGCRFAIGFPIDDGHHDDLGLRHVGLDMQGGVGAVQVDVHQDDIGLELPGQPDNLFRICRLAGHLQISYALQEDTPVRPPARLLPPGLFTCLVPPSPALPVSQLAKALSRASSQEFVFP